MTVRTRTAALAIGIFLLVGLAGCEHVPRFLAWLKPTQKVKVIPVVADLGHVGPEALENRLYARAVKAIEDRDYAMALDALQTAQEARPDDPRVLTAMGVVYDKLGRFDLSRRYYDLAEAADPGSKVVAINRRYSLLLQQRGVGNEAGAGMMLAAADGDGGPSEAASAIRPGPPPSTDLLYASAVSAIQQRQYTRALALLNWAKTTKSDDPRVLSAMGVVYDNLGRFDLSDRYYDLAEQADPGSKVVESDRRYSKILQQHGGVSEGVDMISVWSPPATRDKQGVRYSG